MIICSGVCNEIIFQFKYYSKYDHNPREMSKRMMTKAKVRNVVYLLVLWAWIILKELVHLAVRKPCT